MAELVTEDIAVPKKAAFGRCRFAICFGAGKNANCQTLVPSPLARDEVPEMVALRFLSRRRELTGEPARLKRAGVPLEYQTVITKLQDCASEIIARDRGYCALWLCAFGRCRLMG